jgi:ATP-dependent RNA helicase DeaD
MTDQKTEIETVIEPEAIAFASLGLPENLLSAVLSIGFTSATDIQALTIPPLLAGKDVLGEAQTGTGKN